MSFDVFIALIACAFLNALWNSLLKFKADPSVATTLLAIGGGFTATGMLFFTGTPGVEAMTPSLAAAAQTPSMAGLGCLIS